MTAANDPKLLKVHEVEVDEDLHSNAFEVSQQIEDKIQL